MKYNINEINKQLEEKIIISNTKIKNEIGRIKRGDILIFDKEQLIETLNTFEQNWLSENKVTLIYNIDNNIKIENYIYASIMKEKIPNDIYEDIINKKPELWKKYKELTKNKQLYIQNSKSEKILSDFRTIKNELGVIDLFLIIDNEIDNIKLEKYYWNSYNCTMIIITDIDKFPLNTNNKNIKLIY